MNAINPQAIVAGLGRPLTPKEARVIMAHNSKQAGTQPKKEPAKYIRPRKEPRYDLLEHVGEGTLTAEIIKAVGGSRSNTILGLNELQRLGYVIRELTGSNVALWTRVNRGSGK